MQPPVPSVRPKRRRKGGKFKPSRIKFPGELAVRAREKTADVRAPEWRQAQRGILTNHDLCSKGPPTRIDVTRPAPAAVTSHPRRSIALQVPRTPIRCVGKGALIVHPVPFQTTRL